MLSKVFKTMRQIVDSNYGNDDYHKKCTREIRMM